MLKIDLPPPALQANEEARGSSHRIWFGPESLSHVGVQGFVCLCLWKYVSVGLCLIVCVEGIEAYVHIHGLMLATYPRKCLCLWIDRCDFVACLDLWVVALLSMLIGVLYNPTGCSWEYVGEKRCVCMRAHSRAFF